MKCIMDVDGRIHRVNDQTAELEVEKFRRCFYVPKSEWKKQERKNKSEHDIKRDAAFAEGRTYDAYHIFLADKPVIDGKGY